MSILTNELRLVKRDNLVYLNDDLARVEQIQVLQQWREAEEGDHPVGVPGRAQRQQHRGRACRGH